MLQSKNNCEYCLIFDTFTSITPKFSVAKQFSEFHFGTGGIIFDIKRQKLILNEDYIIYGDIAWISEFDFESEILIAPCMIDIYEKDFTKWPITYQNELKNKYQTNNVNMIRNHIKNDPTISIVFGADLKSLEHVSSLMKRVKDKILDL